MKNWVEQFILREPPYKILKINSDQLKKVCSVQHFSIEQYCENCGKLRTFKSVRNQFSEILSEYHARSIGYAGYKFEDLVNNDERCFVLDFQCQHDCSEHHYFAIKIHNLTIQKIGQYPSFAKEEVLQNLRKYKNIISEYYPELTKALSLYSQNMGIASFVYFRRIFEHLVNKKYSHYGYSKQIKFIDKLKAVEKKEKIVPDDIKEVKEQIYAVLSKGIHEYDEKECIELFPAVQFIIERILDETVYEADKKRKAQEAKLTIQNQLKKGDNN